MTPYLLLFPFQAQIQTALHTHTHTRWQLKRPDPIEQLLDFIFYGLSFRNLREKETKFETLDLDFE